MRKTTVKPGALARCNGRPQLYHSVGDYGDHDRLRIVYPDGRVEYCRVYEDETDAVFYPGCTSGETQRDALSRIADYAKYDADEDLVFIGYL